MTYAANMKVPQPINEPVLSYAPGTPEKKKLKKALSEVTRHEIPLVINGKRVQRKDSVPVLVPHDHKRILGDVSSVEAKDVEDAIAASMNIQKDWARLPWDERAAVFLKAADLIATKYRPAINALTMEGQSKTVHQAEIDAACELADFLRFNAHFAQKIMEEQPISSEGIWNRVDVRPVEGFIYAIGPFNFTAISVNLATSPALMGTPVLWKPAHQAAASSYLAMQILEESGLPPGVINVVHGDHRVINEVAMKSPLFAGVHFTGSTASFEKIWTEVGANLSRYRNYPRIVGETGGKDFVFVHASARADQVVAALVRGGFEYQGQKCSAASRVYMPKSLWSEVKERLLAEVKTIKVGDVKDFSNFMGAVTDERAFNKIKTFIDFARNASDAKIIAGGNCDAKTGYFIEPTVIETTNPRFKTMEEEIFGPVLTIYVYEDKDFEATLKICDETSPYALTGAIFAQDRRHIVHMLDALRNSAGNFYINDKPTGAVVGQQPFGGARKSGTNDKAGSLYNLTRWVSFRTIKENFRDISDYRYSFLSES